VGWVLGNEELNLKQGRKKILQVSHAWKDRVYLTAEIFWLRLGLTDGLTWPSPEKKP